jgi:hypothetical protein
MDPLAFFRQRALFWFHRRHKYRAGSPKWWDCVTECSRFV